MMLCKSLSLNYIKDMAHLKQQNNSIYASFQAPGRKSKRDYDCEMQAIEKKLRKKGVQRISDNFDTWGTIVSIFTFTALYKVTHSYLDALNTGGPVFLAIGISAVAATFVIYATTQCVIKYFVKKKESEQQVAITHSDQAFHNRRSILRSNSETMGLTKNDINAMQSDEVSGLFFKNKLISMVSKGVGAILASIIAAAITAALLNPYTLSGIGGILVTAVLFAGLNTFFQSIIDRRQYQFSKSTLIELEDTLIPNLQKEIQQQQNVTPQLLTQLKHREISQAMHANYIAAYEKQMENKPLYLLRLFVLSFVGSASFGGTNLLISLGTGSALVGNTFLACFTTIPIGLAAAFPRQTTEASEVVQKAMQIPKPIKNQVHPKEIELTLMPADSTPKPAATIINEPPIKTTVQETKGQSTKTTPPCDESHTDSAAPH